MTILGVESEPRRDPVDHEPAIGPAASTVAEAPAADRSAMRRASAGVRRFVSATWLFGLLMLLWQWWASRSESLFFPPVSTILTTLREEFFSGPASRLFLSETFEDNVWASLSRAAQGWLLAVVVGVSLGLVVGVWRFASDLLDPVIRFGMSIPATVLLPLAVVLFGVTDSMNVFLIAFGSVWVILVNTIDAVRNLDGTVLVTARSLRLGRGQIFFRVLLPGASPGISAGIRVSIGITLILMVVSELYAATSGLGYYIVYAQRTFSYEQVWAGVFLLAAIGTVLNAGYAVIERRALRWHRQSTQTDD